MTGNERGEVIRQVEHAVSLLADAMDSACIPEVGMNIVFALPGARDPGDVAGVQGRIVRLGTAVHPVGDVVFGASDHIARIVLTAMKFDPRIRSAANIRFSEKTVRLLEGMMLDVCSFDRTVEPPGVKTMDWGVAQCCRDGVPDIIFDRGAVGKEPMIRVLGEDPGTIARNIIMLSGRIKDTNV
ncbi:MAG: phosphomethylpyrimidine kinase [Methanoculleus sp. SDB]|nr:MAG: phosphomethylpyrimidine kinase [Methanoculleus sp. SDB]